jgi:hypothetical protein
MTYAVVPTRGPWRVVDRPSRGLQIEWGGNKDGEERPICHMRWTDGMCAEVEDRVAADARLIAEAPEMFAALCKILEGFESGVFTRSIEGDSAPGWAINLLPYIHALAAAQQAVARVELAR